MKRANIKYEILIILFRILTIIIILLGLFSKTQNGLLNQFWFFTIQTNTFVLIACLFSIIFQLLNLIYFSKHIEPPTILLTLKLSSTFYISITGFIYCFVLAPVAIITNSALELTLAYRDIFLHIFVPILSIIDYFVLSKKRQLSKTNAFLFLIYPICYLFLIFTRASLGGNAFAGGSSYPYFFIDPTFNSQGWLIVIYYCLICLIFFFLLALIYIYINNKLINKSSLLKSDSK